MQSGSTQNNMPTGSSSSPTQHVVPSQTSQSQQHQQMAYDTQYYYAAPIQQGSQPMSYASSQYAPQTAYYQDGNGQYVAVSQPTQQPMMMPGQPYIYMQPPQQGAPSTGPNGVIQTGTQPIIYYPQPAGTAATPVYYQPLPTPLITADQMGMPIPMMNSTSMPPQIVAQPVTHQDIGGQRAPLTSSTPLPTSMEYETVHRANMQRNKNIQFRYHRVMEHDDDEYDQMLPIDEISKITLDNANDDTMSAEKENQQRIEKATRRGGFSGDFQAHPSNYKTRLCMMHASGAKPCEMGSRCKFAHGLKELRTAEVPMRFPNNKYKTKLCKNFARGGSGFCPYGLRCEFVHPTDKEFHSIPIYQRMLVDENLFDPEMTSEPEDYESNKYGRMQYSQGRSLNRASNPTKVLLKHRNVAGSMMCLSQTGRDAALASGDFNKPNVSQENLPSHVRSRSNKPSMNPQLTKVSRRMSLSQLKTKWTSAENVGGHY